MKLYSQSDSSHEESNTFSNARQSQFTHEGEIYKIGDWVALKTDGDRDWLAMIRDFDVNTQASSSETLSQCGTIICQWAWYPEDLKKEVLPDLDTSIYSCSEIILARNYEDVNPIGSIHRKIEVVDFMTFVQRNEPFPTNFNNQSYPFPLMFWRQEFDEEKGLFPALPYEIGYFSVSERLTLTIRNPDIKYWKCMGNCQVTYHPHFLPNQSSTIPIQYKVTPSEADFTFTCDFCLKSIHIPSATYNSLKNHAGGASTKLISDDASSSSSKSSIKRPKRQKTLTLKYLEIQNELSLKKQKREKKLSQEMPATFDTIQTGNKVKHSSIPTSRLSSSSYISEPSPHSYSESGETSSQDQYISDSTKKTEADMNMVANSKLEEVTPNKEIPKTSDQYNASLIRQRKLCECFQRGYKEIEDLKNSGLSSSLCIYKAPLELAQKVEQAFFNEYHKEDNRQQKQRFFEIYTNLKRDNNADLRRKVICGEMTIEQLVKADTQMLAPDSLQKQREKEQDRFFRESVLLTEETKPIMRKTHKGLEAITPYEEATLQSKVAHIASSSVASSSSSPSSSSSSESSEDTESPTSDQISRWNEYNSENQSILNSDQSKERMLSNSALSGTRGSMTAMDTELQKNQNSSYTSSELAAAMPLTSESQGEESLNEIYEDSPSNSLEEGPSKMSKNSFVKESKKVNARIGGSVAKQVVQIKSLSTNSFSTSENSKGTIGITKTSTQYDHSLIPSKCTNLKPPPSIEKYHCSEIHDRLHQLLTVYNTTFTNPIRNFLNNSFSRVQNLQSAQSNQTKDV